MIENKFDSIAVLNSTIGVQTIERESLIDSTTGAANLDASTMTVEVAISYRAIASSEAGTSIAMILHKSNKRR